MTKRKSKRKDVIGLYNAATEIAQTLNIPGEAGLMIAYAIWWPREGIAFDESPLAVAGVVVGVGEGIQQVP
jgi:hypothetical protein